MVDQLVDGAREEDEPDAAMTERKSNAIKNHRQRRRQPENKSQEEQRKIIRE